MKLSSQKTDDHADGKRRTYGERHTNKQALNGATSRVRVDSEPLLDPVLGQDRKQHPNGDRNR